MTRAVLVTGAAKRLGKAIAVHFAAIGYDVALHYNHSHTEAEDSAAEIKALGRRCTTFKADLAETKELDALIVKAAKEFPGLNALVNSASVFDRGRFMESDVELYHKEFKVNLEAPVFLTQAFAKHIKNGSVVNIIDTNATRYQHSYFFYLLSKKTLLEFSKMAAVELAPHIRVNAVCPGFVLPAEGWGDDYRQELEATLPMGKIATPEDVAKAVDLLVHTPSLTGQVLFVDGGESLT